MINDHNYYAALVLRVHDSFPCDWKLRTVNTALSFYFYGAQQNSEHIRVKYTINSVKSIQTEKFCFIWEKKYNL